MDRAQKQESIESLKSVFTDAGAVVVTHYMGLTVAEMTDLRLRLRKEGASIKVVKNTLAQKALGGSLGEAGDAVGTAGEGFEGEDQLDDRLAGAHDLARWGAGGWDVESGGR